MKLIFSIILLASTIFSTAQTNKQDSIVKSKRDSVIITALGKVYEGYKAYSFPKYTGQQNEEMLMTLLKLLQEAAIELTKPKK